MSELPRRCWWCGQWLGTSDRRRKGRAVYAMSVMFTPDGRARDRGRDLEEYGFHERCWRKMLGGCIMERRRELAAAANERSERCQDTSMTDGGQTAERGSRDRERVSGAGHR